VPALQASALLTMGGTALWGYGPFLKGCKIENKILKKRK
jgi:hypothetical protein